ncbi:hypothetical protein B0H19DRAFT_1193571 [Mycena capillaripes]|nr:hypothetical protein B0H19DRAFT_1193571 [Mycena capillaripes]
MSNPHCLVTRSGAFPSRINPPEIQALCRYSVPGKPSVDVPQLLSDSTSTMQVIMSRIK